MTDARLRLKGLRVPVFAAPMFLVSNPALTIACCKSGVVGSFPTPNVRTPEALDAWLAEIVGALGPGDAPYAVNLVTHRTNARLPLDLEVVARYRPPILITALGGPAPAVEAGRAWGALVLADVNSVFYAKKALDAGADGLVLVAAGAGGHTGHLTPHVFVEEVRRFFDGPICLGGGFSTGAQVLAAQVMGADFAYLGTRFIATAEAGAEDDYKRMLIACGPDDLLVTKAFTGANASMMKPSIVAQGLDPALLAGQTAKMSFTGLEGSEVKAWKGIWSAGQGVGAITDIPPTAELVDRIAAEYGHARARWRERLA